MNKSLAKAMVLVTVICMDLLSGMEFDLFVPSFPELQTVFTLTPFWVAALLSVNFIGYCLSLFFVGILADRYGRKPIIILGLSVFTVGSILCLCTASYEFLLMGRFLQGVGIAAPAILSFLIVADTYPIKQQQFLLAMLNGLMNVAVAVSPVIGSYISLYFHWQGNFIALLLLGLAVLAMTFLFIPNYRLPDHKEEASVGGYVPILTSKPLLLVIVNIIFMWSPYWIFVGMAPLLYMEDMGVSLTHFGYYQGALALIFAAGCILFGLVMHKVNQVKMLKLSGIITVGSLMVILWISFMDNPSPMLITVGLLPFIIGQIIPSNLLYPLCINFMPGAKGRVSAVVQAARLILSSLGLQLAAYYYVGNFQHIGLIISVFILIAIITLYFVMKNRELMQFTTHVIGSKE